MYLNSLKAFVKVDIVRRENLDPAIRFAAALILKMQSVLSVD